MEEAREQERCRGVVDGPERGQNARSAELQETRGQTDEREARVRTRGRGDATRKGCYPAGV